MKLVPLYFLSSVCVWTVASNIPDSLKIKASFLKSVKPPKMSCFYTDAPGY